MDLSLKEQYEKLSENEKLLNLHDGDFVLVTKPFYVRKKNDNSLEVIEFMVTRGTLLKLKKSYTHSNDHVYVFTMIDKNDDVIEVILDVAKNINSLEYLGKDFIP